MKIVNKKFIVNRANCFKFIMNENKEAYTYKNLKISITG